MSNLMRVYKEVFKDVKELGKRIKTAREADPRPLTTICDLINMSRQNWYDIENESQF